MDGMASEHSAKAGGPVRGRSPTHVGSRPLSSDEPEDAGTHALRLIASQRAPHLLRPRSVLSGDRHPERAAHDPGTNARTEPVGDQAQPIEGARYIAEHIPGRSWLNCPATMRCLGWATRRRCSTSSTRSSAGAPMGRGGRSAPRHGAVHGHRRVHGASRLLRRCGVGLSGSRPTMTSADAKSIRAGGRYVTSTGDGLLATFRRASDRGALRRLDPRSDPDLGLEIRAGVHTGEIEFVGNEVRGIAVHIAARVMALAGTVRDRSCPRR